MVAAGARHQHLVRAGWHAIEAGAARFGGSAGLDGNVLNRVDRPAFFESFAEGQAVQYFYEPFLQAFDPQLRKELGVWYTPPEIVRYMVARVDAVLREELDIAAGLADSRVHILDPCCGTGAYLVETLRFIAERLRENGSDALLAHDLKQAAMTRVFGFEIMPAPFVVAHLQLGLLLQTLGAPLDETKQERVAVYLTNALTGWESLEKPKQHSLLPELEQERTTASRMKQQAPILVVLGNPPYNGFAGVAVAEERDLSTAYRSTQRAPTPQGQGLNDLYVRFFRMAERRIVEMSKRGVVCFISNYSWLDGLSFTGMRERYLKVFDEIFIDCLNGDKYKTGKLTPEGDPDPSIFSTERNREGIQVGTAITLLVRRDAAPKNERVHFRHFWGRAKRALLKDAARCHPQIGYDMLTPVLELGLPFTPTSIKAAYTQWPLLPDLFPASFPGVKTSRDDFLVEIERDRLLRKMMIYFDPTVSHEAMRRQYPGIMTDNARFRTEAARDVLRQRGFLPDKIIRYAYRPFDVRWLYWEPETDLLDRKREDYFAQVFEGNCWLEARQRQPFDQFNRGCFSRVLADNLGNGLSSYFPLFLKNLLGGEIHPNLSPKASAYLRDLDATAESLFFHTLAILHAPAYRQENAGALRQDWPRIPLPVNRERLESSAALGRQLAALLDTETAAPGVTSGAIRPELRALAVLSHLEPGKPLDPAAGDLDLTAGWGHAGKGSVTMPGRGNLTERDYTSAERAALGETAASLGERTYDIFLNDRACWRNIPTRVWNYTLGGYQVIKKWLSYREKVLLGRSLKPEEARTVTQIARRIAAIVLMEAELDGSYRAVTAAESGLKSPPSLPPSA
ncbi:MAG: type ISP restriction/modification enzyme [Candidatus Competibacteraceae bacterium]